MRPANKLDWFKQSRWLRTAFVRDASRSIEGGFLGPMLDSGRFYLPALKANYGLKGLPVMLWYGRGSRTAQPLP